jgi:iron complex transport system ATP-binding protein
MLHVKDLTFEIKGKKLLQDINFEAQPSQMRVFIGPNGAGKTTLLKTIAKIYKNSSGAIKLYDEDISNLSTKELSQKISYMPQFSETPNISVLEVLELGRYTFSGARLKQKDREVIHEIIHDFHLEQILDKDIATLSGGQRQKVFLASSLVQEPKLLILDEPISHLDPKNQLDVLRAIKKLTKEKGIITLIVLHDIQHALHYGDTLLMMKDTRVVFDIHVADIKEEYLNEIFDVEAKLFKEENHTFVYYQHSHLHVKNHTH